MTDIVTQISLIVPIFSIGFVIFITSINLYIKIRRKFPITVNCWFCNQNARVPFANWNSWHCPKCEQYNGFTKDGDYNCDIPAQRQSKLNKPINSSSASVENESVRCDLPKTNGLCEPCNRNQELKMQQLASFTPVNECDFDEEIDEFKQKLEQSYRLCSRCERHLKRTLNRVKKNVLGSKLAQIGAKGLRALDMHVAAIAKMNDNQKRQTIATICLSIICCISIIGLYKIGQNANITKAKLETTFSPFCTSTILMGMSYLTAVKIITVNSFNYLLELPYISQCSQVLNTFTTSIYLLITGDVFDYVKQNIWTNMDTIYANLPPFGPQPERLVESTIEHSVVVNLAGCALSMLVILVQGIEYGPVLSLFIWSMNMAIPSIFHKSAGLQIELIVDLLKIIAMLSALFTSIWNLIFRISPEPTDNQLNNSFRRINYDYNSDISDESEAETDLNISQQSVYSNRPRFSKRSPKMHNNSFNISNNSISPSVFSASSKKDFVTSSNVSLNHFSPKELNRTYTKNDSYNWGGEASHNKSNNNLFNGQQSCASEFSSVSGRMRNSRRSNPFDAIRSTFATSSVSHNPLCATIKPGQQQEDTSFNSRCSSRNSCYDVPDDFQSGITHLSIGSTRKQLEYAKRLNPSLFGMSSIPSTNLRHRRHLLHPAKLNYTDNQQRVLAAHQTSWVAGGYWNQGMSPQKRHSNLQHESIFGQAKNVFPVISRTSSQSSGFESQSSSLKNGQENHSNENSISDEIERESVFSEPAYFVQQPSGDLPNYSGSAFAKHTNGNERPITQQLSQPIYSGMGETNGASFLQPQTSFTFGHNRPHSTSILNSEPFDSSSVSVASIRPLPQHENSSYQKAFNSTSFNFNRFDKNLPTFKRGSLLRINPDTNRANNLNNIDENMLSDS